MPKLNFSPPLNGRYTRISTQVANIKVIQVKSNDFNMGETIGAVKSEEVIKQMKTPLSYIPPSRNMSKNIRGSNWVKLGK